MASLPHLTEREHLTAAAELIELANKHIMRAGMTSNDGLREELETLKLPLGLPCVLRTVVDTTCPAEVS